MEAAKRLGMRAEWDDVRIKSWARDVGPSTLAVVERIFDSVDIKEQAYNPALAVLNLTKTYTERDLEAACAYAPALPLHQVYPGERRVEARAGRRAWRGRLHPRRRVLRGRG